MIVRKENVAIELPDGTIVHAEVTALGGEEEVAFELLKFDGFINVLRGFTKVFVETLHDLEPTKASIEFGLEMALESGKLTALLTQGSAKANLTVKLEWEQKPKCA